MRTSKKYKYSEYGAQNKDTKIAKLAFAIAFVGVSLFMLHWALFNYQPIPSEQVNISDIENNEFKNTKIIIPATNTFKNNKNLKNAEIVITTPRPSIISSDTPKPQRKPKPIKQAFQEYEQNVENLIENTRQSIHTMIAASAHRKQIECIAKNVYYEARNQPYSGQVAVAMVTLNRSKNKNMSPCAVVYESNTRGCQFTWTCTRTRNETAAIRREDWQKALSIAYVAYNSSVNDLTDGATYYYNPYKVRPAWARDKIPVNNNYISNGYLGEHRFFKPNAQESARYMVRIAGR